MLSRSRQHALRTHKPTSQIACAFPKGPADERHLLILDSHTSEADGFETHNTGRKLPSGICHVEVLVRNLATRKAFGAVFRKSASGLRSTMRNVQDQDRGTRQELDKALRLTVPCRLCLHIQNRPSVPKNCYFQCRTKAEASPYRWSRQLHIGLRQRWCVMAHHPGVLQVVYRRHG
jgi:hypothetical protein